MEPPAPGSMPRTVEPTGRRVVVAPTDPQLQLTPDELELLLQTTTPDEADHVPPSPHTSGDDNGSSTDTMTTIDPKRARRSEIEKLSRRRRQSTLREMREKVKILEQQMNAMLLAARETRDPEEEPTHINSSSDQNAPEKASFVALRKKYVQLAIDAQRLENEKTEMRRMLRSRQLLSQSVQSLAAAFADDWEESSWHNMVHRSYVPLPREEHFRIMRESFEAITNYSTRKDVVSSGQAFMGWVDRRHVDDEGMFFSFTKTFLGRDPERVMLDSWSIFSQEALLRKTMMLTSNAYLRLRVLQEPNDDVLVLHRHTRYTHVKKAFHTVYLLFRLRTDDGFTICFRTIPAPEFQESLEETGMWVDIFHWVHFKYARDETTGDSLGCEVVFGGAIGGRLFESIEKFLLGSFASVVRWENAAIAPMFLVSSTTESRGLESN